MPSCLGDGVPYRKLAYLPDRRSTRVEESIAMNISGFDSSHSPYREKVSTLSVSCHGCRYLSGNRVGVGEMTILELMAMQGDASASPALARIRSVKQVPDNPMAFEIAVELALPRNIWGVASPPEDWTEFEYREDPQSTARKLDTPPVSESKRAQVLEAKPALVEPLRASRIVGDGGSQARPPLLAYPTASHETAKSVAIPAAKPATGAASSIDSLDELCSRLESRANQVLATLMASFANEISGRSGQFGQASLPEAFEGSILGFERPTPNPARRSA